MAKQKLPEACLYCGHRFTGWQDQKRHMKTHPPETRRLECATCGRVFVAAGSAYLRHVRAHETIVERFWSWVDKSPDPDGCWMWRGRPSWHGYGTFYTGHRPGLPVPEKGSNKAEMSAHRFSYELNVGPIPEGMTLDHTCHNADPDCADGNDCPHRRCVNPAHLEPCERVENQRRAIDTRTKVHRCRLCDFATTQWPGFQSHMRHKHPELYQRKAKPVPAKASVYSDGTDGDAG